MAGDDDVDQDALAAEWGMELEMEDGDEGAGSSGASAGDGAGGFDEDMAAQWAAMIGDDSEEEEATPADKGGAERILSQDEIDSLLGFDPNEAALSDQTGIRAIINSALVSYERLPMLEIIFDRLVRLLTTSLRNFTSDNVEVSLDTITSVRFGDYLNSIPLPAVLSVFKAEEWDNYGMYTVDSNLIYSIVDVLLGGRQRSQTMRVEGRPYTTIEMALVRRMIELVLADSQIAFEPVSAVNFRLDRLETNPRFAPITAPANACILIRFRIDMEDRGGRMEMLLPYSTIEPIRELLMQMFMGEKFGRDSIWENHFASTLSSAEVEVQAVLEETDMPLSKLLNMKVGETLMFDRSADDPVSLRCGNVYLTSGHIGRMENQIAVKVEDKLAKPKMTLAAFEKADRMEMERS